MTSVAFMRKKQRMLIGLYENKKVNYFPAFLDELWERLYTKTIFVLIYEKNVFVERKQENENL